MQQERGYGEDGTQLAFLKAVFRPLIPEAPGRPLYVLRVVASTQGHYARVLLSPRKSIQNFRDSATIKAKEKVIAGIFENFFPSIAALRH